MDSLLKRKLKFQVVFWPSFRIQYITELKEVNQKKIILIFIADWSTESNEKDWLLKDEQCIEVYIRVTTSEL